MEKEKNYNKEIKLISDDAWGYNNRGIAYANLELYE
jgi:hypothetical protein